MLDQLLRITQPVTGNALVAGNDARVLVDGPATFRSMFDDIARARESIHLETFILDGTAIGEELAQLLIASRQRGVEVRVLIDAIGSLELPSKFVQRLRDHDIDVHSFRPFNPVDPRLWRLNSRNHRKLLIIDGRIAYGGGTNISGAYSRGSFRVAPDAKASDAGWRDTHLRIVGPVVHQLQRQFLKMWNKDLPKQQQVGGASYFPPTGSVGDMMVGVMSSGGGDNDEFDIYTVLAAAISHAQHRVWITQGYFAPDPTFLDILKATARRGVDVRLLLPSVTDVPLLLQASRFSYEELLQAGVRIYERQGAMLHAKTIVVDSVWVSVGSTNLDYRSFVYNFELNTFIISDALGRAMDKLFLVDLQYADDITLRTWQRRPLPQRLGEILGNLFRPML
jgi:cardiolipin synthase